MLSLEFNMPYNQTTQKYDEKKCEILAVIVFQGKVKSGGYAKFNLADNLNSNPHGQLSNKAGVSKVTVPLAQCPDPSANVEIELSYERLSDQIENDSVSVLNISAQDMDMSKIDFQDDKITVQIGKMGEMVKKLEDLSKKVKKNKNKEEQSSSVYMEQKIKKLQKTIIEKDKQQQEQNKTCQHKEEELQKQLEKKNKQIKDLKSGDSKENKVNYKQLYENAMNQLEELRDSDGNMRKSLDLKLTNQLEDVKQIADLGSNKLEEHSDDLSRENLELQSQVALMSHKLAQLFNASYQFGGAKLLDYLQTSIGLTQLEE